jgi:hypothetical protein
MYSREICAAKTGAAHSIVTIARALVGRAHAAMRARSRSAASSTLGHRPYGPLHAPVVVPDRARVIGADFPTVPSAENELLPHTARRPSLNRNTFVTKNAKKICILNGTNRN